MRNIRKSVQQLSHHELSNYDIHPYSSKIIKAGALIGDTKTLLTHWNITASVSDNINRLHKDNIFGKASRSRVTDILTIFRQRYLIEDSLISSLVIMTHGKVPKTAIDKILYYHTALADKLLYDTVLEIIFPMYEGSFFNIDVLTLKRFLAQWVAEGKTRGQWSDNTIVRIARGLLSTLRDFGVLQGVVDKRVAPIFLPVEAFSYIVFYMKQHQPSGVRILENPDWKLFLLTKEGVERLLFEARAIASSNRL